jgi:hypothetical protein
MILMIKNLAEPEPIEIGDHGALIEVRIYDEDEKLDLAACARADYVPEEARSSG